jgi:hypothetical protein
MAQQCRTCAHPDIDAINIALAADEYITHISTRYGVGTDSLKRHKTHHLTPAVIRLAAARRNEGSAVPAYERLEDLYNRASALMAQAENKGSIVGGAAVLRELRQIVETLAKLTGELDERPQITVNLLSSPEVIEVLGRLMAALAPYPDARIAAAAAIDAEVLPA